MLEKFFGSLLAATLFFLAFTGGEKTSAQTRWIGNVYTATNSPDGNSVRTYLRLWNGSLVHLADTPTGGLGSGSGLGNQGGVTLSQNGRWLFAVNAGSNSVSIFRVLPFGFLLKTDEKPSRGGMPVSVTSHRNSVYVLNAEGRGSIQGFKRNWRGKLRPIPGSKQRLSGAETTAAAQVQFSPNGRQLVVTEKATNLIDVFPVNRGGKAGPGTSFASSGETPFGFDFNQRNHLIVSEAFGGAAGAGAVSSYRLNRRGELEIASGTVENMQSAACWIEITGNGRFAFTTNTATGNISGYKIHPKTGELTLLADDGISASTGDSSAPIDIAITRDSRLLYVLNSGTDEIVVLRVNPSNGRLRRVGQVAEVPDGANGLIAR